MGEAAEQHLNIADWFLDARVREGRGERVALRSDAGDATYAEVQELSNRFAHLLREAGVQPEQRVIIALPDSIEWVGAFFGVLKIGAVVVMVNPHLKPEAIDYFLSYTRATAAVVCDASRAGFEGARQLRALLIIDQPDLRERLSEASSQLQSFPSHRDDAAIWLFSGGTTGKPKAVVQSHASFVYTTRCYGQGILAMGEDDVVLSVPKLFFGYATGSNLLFPFSVGGSAVLFPERCTADVLFDKIARYRPTVLINVPTMINNMLASDRADNADLSSLRLATSAGEALPEELYDRWKEAFGVELLDGLGTAEQWHVFVSNRPGDVKPGTLGKVVPGFEVRVCDEEGHDLPHGEIGYLWVRGGARELRAIGSGWSARSRRSGANGTSRGT